MNMEIMIHWIYILTKINQLDAAVSLGILNETCDNETEVTIFIVNNGSNIITNIQFEIIINGQSAGIFNEQVEIESQSESSNICYSRCWIYRF